MKATRTQLSVSIGTGLIVFTAVALIALLLVDRSPSRTLQRLGFSLETIDSIRYQAKKQKFNWSFDDNHPSFNRATMGSDTNHAVPNPVAKKIANFVREKADYHHNNYFRPILLKNLKFRSYGRGYAWRLPDRKEIYAYVVNISARYPTTDTIVAVYDPLTKTVSSVPYTTGNRSVYRRTMLASTKNIFPFIKITQLRDEFSYEIAIRLVGRNGTAVFDRYYIYHRVDENLNLVPVLEQLQQCYRIARKFVYSEIERTNKNDVVLRYTAKRDPKQEQHDEVGWRRFKWNTSSNVFELVESHRLYEEADLDWILNNKVFPELAPTNPPPATTSENPWPQGFVPPF